MVILLLFLFFFLFFFSIRYFSQRTSFSGLASDPAGSGIDQLVLDNCYLFASPLQAKADGAEKIRITVFVLSSQGKGIGGEAVFLGEDDYLVLTAIQSVTDETGRALFDLSSTLKGEYLVEARIGGQVLPQRVRVSFY